jgi:hypothetical protein
MGSLEYRYFERETSPRRYWPHQMMSLKIERSYNRNGEWTKLRTNFPLISLSRKCWWIPLQPWTTGLQIATYHLISTRVWSHTTKNSNQNSVNMYQPRTKTFSTADCHDCVHASTLAFCGLAEEEWQGACRALGGYVRERL